LTYPILLDFKLAQHASLLDQPTSYPPKIMAKTKCAHLLPDATKEAKPFEPVIMDENSP